MKTIKKMVALFAAIAMLGTATNKLEAATYSTDAGGCGYEECRTAPCLSAAIALGTIAAAAIIAVAIQNSNGKGHHGHCH